jgi:glutamine amidotransferase
MIAIIDYGIGNVGSIENMLKKAGERDVVLAHDASVLRAADRLILPGVGAFDAGINMMNQSGMREELDIQVLEQNKPILGICLGMQMLGMGSEEGKLPGLGYVNFDCKKFSLPRESNLKIPHMGWDYIKIVKKNDALVNDFSERMKFYFVHSFYALCERSDDVLMTCNYGFDFTAAVVKGNVYGVQFHPEKSHRFGMKLLENFMRI